MGSALCGSGCLGCSFCDGGPPYEKAEKPKPLTVKLGDVLKQQEEKSNEHRRNNR